MEKEKEVITVPTQARALIHLWDAPFSPVEAQVHFCSASFEEVARVLMGDAHPKNATFIVFDRIQPEISGRGGSGDRMPDP
jgi:hypothetical protein